MPLRRATERCGACSTNGINIAIEIEFGTHIVG